MLSCTNKVSHMTVADRKLATETLTLRLDRQLKDEFLAVAEEEKRPVSGLVRSLMLDHIERRRREQYEADARRQSQLLSASFTKSDEKEMMLWFEETWNMDGWS